MSKIHNAHAIVSVVEKGHIGIYVLTQHVDTPVDAEHPARGVKIGLFHPENGTFIPREDFQSGHFATNTGFIPYVTQEESEAFEDKFEDSGVLPHSGLLLRRPDPANFKEPADPTADSRKGVGASDRTPANRPKVVKDAAIVQPERRGDPTWFKPDHGFTAVAHQRTLQLMRMHYPRVVKPGTADTDKAA